MPGDHGQGSERHILDSPIDHIIRWTRRLGRVMSNWVRLWDDMPTDPKWRLIARKSGQHMTLRSAVHGPRHEAPEMGPRPPKAAMRGCVARDASPSKAADTPTTVATALSAAINNGYIDINGKTRFEKGVS